MPREYKVVTYYGDWRFGTPSQQFDAAITGEMANGWRPLGGVSHVINVDDQGNETITYAQALIRDTDPPESART